MRRLILAALLLTAAPAFADEACSTTPAQIRNAATTADANAAKRALGYVSIGEKLCEAGNERAANKKFSSAIKVLNADPPSLCTAAAAK